MKILAMELSSGRGSLAWLTLEEELAGAPAAAREGTLAPQNEDVAEPGEAGQLLQKKSGASRTAANRRSRATQLIDPIGCPAGATWVDLVREWPNDRKNSGPFFENLANAQKQFGPADTIVVGLGPGSYAGVRIAISAATGLQTASGARVIGFPSICAIQCEEKEYCVVGDARRKSFFFARIRANELTEGPALFGENELREKIDKLEDNIPIFASEDLPQFKRAVIRYPSAKVLAQLTQGVNRNFALPPLEPIYLREPHITLAKAQEIGS